MVGLTSKERAYQGHASPRVSHLKECHQENNLSVNVSKTKDMKVDFGKKKERSYSPLMTNRESPSEEGASVSPLTSTP